MGIKLSDLIPDFREKVDALLDTCNKQGVRMVPTFTLRSPSEQAVFWRQSRSIVEINQAIEMLKAESAFYLASVLEGVGPHSGPHVTNGLPGNSWHQWGEALDCMWEVDGKFIDSDLKKVNGMNGYQVYAATAKSQGLDSGYYWKSFRDSGHVQLRGAANPHSSGISWADIDAQMKARFGGQLETQSHSLSAEVAMGVADPIQLSYAAPAGWRIYETTDKTAAVFRSGLAIDADGAPKAYNSNNAIALDYLANAGRPGNWWALVKDSSGNPVVQSAQDPAPGYYVSTTTLENVGFDRKNDPRRYVDASTIPYVVLPGNRYLSFLRSSRIRLGDLAACYNIRTGKLCFAIFADTGPATKLGEGSIALANSLGLVGNPKAGGTGAREIVTAVFPATGLGRGMAAAEIDTRVSPIFEAWGGLARLSSYKNL